MPAEQPQKIRHPKAPRARAGSGGREHARGEARELLDELLALRIGDIRPQAVVEAVEASLTPETVREVIGPVLRAIDPLVVAELRRETRPIGEYVPEQARRAIDRLLERGDLMPEPLVRKLFEHEAVIDAISGTLHDGITQFNSTVNPFFAEWGLPSILKRMPVGGGMILATMETLRADFERRLEPELRKFLTPFSRRAAAQLAETVVTRSSDPKLVELRRSLTEFLYSQSLAALMAGVDARAVEDAGIALEQVLIALAEDDRVMARARDALQAFVEEHRDETVGQWLDAAGVNADGIIGPAAAALWPALEQALRTAGLRRIVERMLGAEHG